MSESKKESHDNVVEPKYLYNGAAAHPVEEFIDTEDALTSDPSFVLEVTWPRIVQFYLPSSKLCQEFKPRFIELARELRHRSKKVVIEFHTVSCAVHSQICATWEIEGVPHVLLFRSGMTEGETLIRTDDNKLEAEYVAETIGISLLEEDFADGRHNVRPDYSVKQNFIRGVEKNKEAILDVSHHIDDAGKSLVNSLQTILDIEKESPTLSYEQLDTFHEWIDLLRWALPPQLKIHNLINDVRQNIDTIVSNTDQFSTIIRSHNQLITKHWSHSCSHGKIGTGYACGIWKLFHIVSIGVAEQHKSVLGEGVNDRVSTQKAAEIMRNFVEDFFFICEDCKAHFLDLYDNCMYDRCRRLSTDHSTKWNELAMWLWEVHNDVNVRVLKDAMSKDGRISTKEDQMNALWPSRSECNSCWKRDGSWDEVKIYNFLHTTYW